MHVNLSDLIIAILTFIATGLGFIIREQREKLKTVRNQLSEKKYNVYHKIYTVFFDLFTHEKFSGKKPDEIKLAKELIEIKKDLLIYAPDIVVKKFLDWNYLITENQGSLNHAPLFLELFVLIRKDMGNPKTFIKEYDILRMIMKNDTETQSFTNLMNKKS